MLTATLRTTRSNWFPIVVSLYRMGRECRYLSDTDLTPEEMDWCIELAEDCEHCDDSFLNIESEVWHRIRALDPLYEYNLLVDAHG